MHTSEFQRFGRPDEKTRGVGGWVEGWGGGGVLDRINVLDLMHGRSRMRWGGGKGPATRAAMPQSQSLRALPPRRSVIKYPGSLISSFIAFDHTGGGVHQRDGKTEYTQEGVFL